MTAAMRSVSVIIPAFDAARFIGEAVSSALSQTRPPAEVIVVDDGSSDATADLVERLPGVRCVRQLNAGAAAARNRGVAAARGDFLAFLDADDCWTPDKLACQLAAVEAEPGLELVLAHCVQVRQERWAETVAAPGRPDARHPVPGYVAGTCLVGRDAFARVGGFDASLRAGEFIDWFLRARAAGLAVSMLPQALLWRRLHDANFGIVARAAYADYARALKRELDRRRAGQAS